MSNQILVLLVAVSVAIQLARAEDISTVHTVLKQTVKKVQIVKKESTDMVTQSKYLKDLIALMDKGDFENFHKLYDEKALALKSKKDDLFYKQFKDLFIENDLSSRYKITLLTFLLEIGTKESVELLFGMIDEDIVKNENIIGSIANVLKRGPTFLNQRKKDGEFMDTLVAEYQKTENQWMMTATARVIGNSSRDDAIKILARDYVEAMTPERKGAARSGLMSIHGKEPLPLLATYVNAEDKKVHQVGAMVLANIASNESSQALSSWVMEKATIDDVEDIKKWYKGIINSRDAYHVTKNIVVEKIRDDDLRDELDSFLKEEVRTYEEMIAQSEKSGGLNDR